MFRSIQSKAPYAVGSSATTYARAHGAMQCFVILIRNANVHLREGISNQSILDVGNLPTSIIYWLELPSRLGN